VIGKPPIVLHVDGEIAENREVIGLREASAVFRPQRVPRLFRIRNTPGMVPAGLLPVEYGGYQDALS